MTTHFDRAGRLMNLAFPIFRANADLCYPTVKHSLGFDWITVADLDEYTDVQKYYLQSNGVGIRPTVLHVFTSGPAAASGLQRWDVLVEINGIPIPNTDRRHVRYDIGEIFWNETPKDVVELVYERDGHQYTTQIHPELACDYSVVLKNDGDINAFADFGAIYVTTGMVRAFEDESLGFVIGHELAHHAEGHVETQHSNRVWGNLLDLVVLAGSGQSTGGAFGNLAGAAYSKDFEREADYVGMYMLARAGIDTAKAVDVFRLLAIERPEAVYVQTTHPTSAERFLNLELIHEEIEAKRNQGVPLLPNREYRE